jgi:RiboL-PSP-HEPN
MPSASVLHWRNDRMPRLREVDLQCAASLAAVPPNPELIDENLRGYVLLLSAHFQGFCRDLYTECAQILVFKVRPALQVVIERQFTAQRTLDHGNPNLDNLRKDFERFDFTLDLAGADPANPPRVTHLGELNKWRNIAAHQGTIPGGVPPLSLALLQGWRHSCDGLATSLDDIMYNRMRRILHRAPW